MTKTKGEQAIATIQELDAIFEEKTGHRAFCYVSEPTPTQVRVVFRDGTKLSYEEGVAWMQHLLAAAVAGTLNVYPYDHAPS